MQFSIALQLEAVNGNTEPVPPLVFVLLRGVKQSSNLTLAAKAADVSYRKAWNLLGYWSMKLGAPLLDTTRGRGAKLTALGAKLLWARSYMDTQGAENLAEVIGHVHAELQSVLPEKISNRETVKIAASHCVCLDILQNMYQGTAPTTISLELFGSQTSLSRLRSGECEIAGFHIAAAPLGSGHLDIYRNAVNLSLISAVHSHQRRQGLIVSNGNPRGLHAVTDITKPGVKMINRQAGSGTRVLFDMLITSAGINGEGIPGYYEVEQTHTGVCARIANQLADVAMGTEASAAQFGLDFIPLVDEDYYFGFRQENADSQAVRALVSLLGSRAWAQAINLIPGMNAEGAGAVVKDVSKIANQISS